MPAKSKNQVITNLDELTEAQLQKVQDIKADGGVAEITKCRFCGKILIRDKSIEQEAGDLCEKLHEKYTPEELAQAKMNRTVTQLPEGYIAIPVLHKICEANGVPVNRMVNAIGRDRGLSEPIDERLRPVYFGRTRYVSGWAATPEGLAVIAGSKPTKAQKAQQEVAELEKVWAEEEAVAVLTK